MSFLLLFLILGPQLEAGEVEVIREGDRITYLLKNGVTVKFEDKILTGKEGTYEEERGIARIYGGVSLKAPDYTVRAESLIYREKKRSVTFIGNVEVRNRKNIFCDSLLSVKDTIYLMGNIAVESGRVRLYGSSGTFFAESKRGVLRGNPEAVMGDNKEVRVEGDEIEFSDDTMVVYGNVKLHSENLDGVGDTLIYSTKDSKGMLKGNVRVEFEGGLALADSARWQEEDGTLRKVVFMGRARVISKSEEGEISLTAPQITANTENGQLASLYGINLKEGTYKEKGENGDTESPGTR